MQLNPKYAANRKVWLRDVIQELERLDDTICLITVMLTPCFLAKTGEKWRMEEGI